GVSINEITWHWLTSELGGYDESTFELWRYDSSGWTNMGATLDTGANTLSLTNMIPASVYGILQNTSTTPEDENPNDEDKEFTLSFDSTCDGNTLTVTYNGNPVPGASVNVYNPNNMQTIALGTTNASGEFEFDACSLTVQIHISRNGYDSETITETLITCCEEECTLNEDCPDNQECDDGMCTDIPCTCGQIQNHQCIEYECCFDNDCAEGQCINNTCLELGCQSDEDCQDSEYCDSGECIPVTGECGYPENHAWVSYECGDDPNCPVCPDQEFCKDHICIEGGLTGPGTGFVGDNATFNGTENGGSCVFCDVEITDPTGKKYSAKTGSDGSLTLPLTTKGNYTITLLAPNGLPAATLIIEALPKAPGEDISKPTEVSPTETLLWLLIIVLALIILFLYWRKKKK
ncbi:hypothetical protein KKB44_03635, partial [Candidatus Micrarchaeota archaeon]|nr:hypothetical protein [Candidatus Micrarchaeota archaeon]